MLRIIGNKVELFAKAHVMTTKKTHLFRIARLYSINSAESSDSADGTGFSCLSVKQRTPSKHFSGSHAPESPDPMMCCGSGCVNCVWIEYGIQRAFYYNNEPLEKTLQEIDENVFDQCLREYIKREIRKRTRR